MGAAPAQIVDRTTGQPFGNYIAGAWRPAATGETFEHCNPADRDDLIGHLAGSGQEDVEVAAAAAAEAAEGWRRASAIARANIL